MCIRFTESSPPAFRPRLFAPSFSPPESSPPGKFAPGKVRPRKVRPGKVRPLAFRPWESSPQFSAPGKVRFLIFHPQTVGPRFRPQLFVHRKVAHDFSPVRPLIVRSLDFSPGFRPWKVRLENYELKKNQKCIVYKIKVTNN